ncbi:MAG: sulfatase-like hydrolase/transferase [Rikenellaceae bacterium]
MQPNTNFFRYTAALSLICAAVPTLCSAKGKVAKQPNIIFILSDDAGYADFGFQGSKQFETPNLDKMAGEGMIFNQIYTTDAVSGPSRAGLMTGRYQQRFGIEENNVRGLMSENGKCTADDMGVPLDQKFVSNYLKDLGYKTAIFGKWHLGSEDDYHPMKRGFDRFVGFRSGARSFYAYKDLAKYTGEEADKALEYGFGEFREPAQGEYMTDLLAGEAIKFIKENRDNPFYIYLSFNAVHSPLEANPEDVARYKHIESPKRRKLAAMTYAMDRACGEVMDALKAAKLDNNTIIVFSNDNGGPNGTETSNYPLSGMKGSFLEGGVRVPGFVRYPKVIEAGGRYEYPVSFMDFLPTFVELAGGEVPEDACIDGVDILPYLKGESSGRPHQTLYWKCENRGVVRDGDMKFMRFPDRPAELYDISKDEGEHNNLADKNPDLMRKYYKMLFDWEMTLERPLWMLERFCEKRVMEQFYEQEEYRYPQEQL